MRHTAKKHTLHASVTVPYPLPDEAAAVLIELLHQLTESLESQYAAPLRRYYYRTEQRQAGLSNDDEPPF